MGSTDRPVSIFKEHIQKASRFQLRKPTPDKNEYTKFYKLSSNENMLGTSPLALKAISKAVNGLYEYDHYDDLLFQQTLSDFYKNELQSGQFITANSGVEVLEIICRGFVGVGTECIISSPTFSPYKNMVELEGGIVVDIPLRLPDFTLDVEGILAAVNENTRLLFITNPNNPTGTYINKKEMDRLFEALPAHVIVVYDEVYFHFVEADDFPFAIDYVKAGKNIIGIHTFSKIYGLAGLRIGYGFSTSEISEYLNKIFRPFRINTLAIIGATAALQDKQHVMATREMVRLGKKYLYQKFKDKEIKFWPSQGNFILFKPSMDSLELTAKMLKEGVMVRPGDSFGAAGCIRMTIGTQEANQRFWEVLEPYLD